MAAPKTWEELWKVLEHGSKNPPRRWLNPVEDENEEPIDPENDPLKEILKNFPKKEP